MRFGKIIIKSFQMRYITSKSVDVDYQLLIKGLVDSSRTREHNYRKPRKWFEIKGDRLLLDVIPGSSRPEPHYDFNTLLLLRTDS